MYLGHYSNVFRESGENIYCLINARNLTEARRKFLKHMDFTKRDFKDYKVNSWGELWDELSRGDDTWEVYPAPKLLGDVTKIVEEEFG